MSTENEVLTPEEETNEGRTLRLIGWFSLGIVVAVLGIYLGTELRSRYKFKHRTPYDFFANAGETHASEFGIGV
ncbi:MAG: hypothetical protein ABSC88_02905 [Terracidiphilus sp.]|jgi:hypothetical protein|nr:hypothetical protein [Terracidiphilus sp.]